MLYTIVEGHLLEYTEPEKKSRLLFQNSIQNLSFKKIRTLRDTQ